MTATNDAASEGSAPSLAKPSPRRVSPRSLANLKPFVKGQSGNPRGRPDRLPVIKLAKKHTKKAIETLAALLDHPDPEVRRKSALALIHEAYGAPPTSQEVVRPPLVSINQQFNNGMGASGMDATAAYKAMVSGTLDADPDHPAFHPALEAPAADASEVPDDSMEVSE